MRFTASAILGLLAVQRAAACESCVQSIHPLATIEWLANCMQNWDKAPGLPSCQNACNECSDEQKSGLDFNNAQSGSNSYGGLELQGFTVGSWGDGKRDFVPRGSSEKRTYGNKKDSSNGKKCARGSASKKSGPSLSCGAKTKPFSINLVHLSVDQDTPVLFTYHYDHGPNAGKTCTHTAKCSKGSPNAVHNTQCGGASRVECSLPPESPHESCDIGIHSVKFDCTPCSSSRPPSSASSPPTSSQSSATVVTSSTAPPVVSSAPFPVPPSSSAIPPGPTAPLPPHETTGAPPPPPQSSGAPPPSHETSSVPLPPHETTGAPPPPPQSSGAPPPSHETSSAPLPPHETAGAPPPPPQSSGVIPPPPKNQTTSVVPTVPAPPESIVTSISPQSPPVPGQSSSSVPPESIVTSISPQSPPAPGQSSSSVPPESSITSVSPQTSSVPIVQSTVPVVTSEIVYTTVTSCSQTTTHTNGGSTSVEIIPTVSTVVVTSIKTICTKCVAPPVTESPLKSAGSPPESAVTSSPGTIQEVVTTEVAHITVTTLPVTHTTWITLTNCKDNSDSDCFCKDSDFTNNVQQCVSSWSNDAAVQQAALSYFAGICAPYAAVNPGIVVNVPSTITLAPIPMSTHSQVQASSAPGAGEITAPAVAHAPVVASSAGLAPVAASSAGPAAGAASPAGSVAGAAPPAGPAAGAASSVAPVPAASVPATAAPTTPPPATTISISTTLTLPCPPGATAAAVNQITDSQGQVAGSTAAASSCVTTTVIDTSVTVPQVAFTTSNSAVGLVAGTPAAAPASPTAVVPPGVPAPSGIGAPTAPSVTGVTPFTGAAAKAGQNGVLMSMVFAAVGFAVLA
ncbi:MAG: hypothetical protein Q9217_003272 [Psora testacea]